MLYALHIIGNAAVHKAIWQIHYQSPCKRQRRYVFFYKAPKIFTIFSYHNLYRKDPRAKGTAQWAKAHKAAAV